MLFLPDGEQSENYFEMSDVKYDVITYIQEDNSKLPLIV